MSNDRVETGHISRFWNEDFKSLPFVKQPITEEEIRNWQSQGYDHVKSFSGSMYDSRNIMPDWVLNMNQMFGMHSQTYTLYCMTTLEIMPVHADHFNTYCRLHNTTGDKVQRVILMLEDWKPGHYFELDGIGYVNWKAGDWFKWTGDVPHAASNIGTQPRYTLQITGMPVASGQMNKLFINNVPDIENNCSHPFVVNDVLPKIKDEHVMVFMQNGYISDLDDITHSPTSTDLLNNNGLHIYLYEPMCSYHKDSIVNEYAPYTKHNQNFYSEFRHPIYPDELRAEELDSIYQYATRNNLTNVTVHTGDYNVSTWYTHYTDRLTLICDDLFLKTQRKIRNLNETFRNQFNNKFVCLNWRFTNHRQLVSTFLAGETINLSWYHKTAFENLNKNLFFDLSLWEQTHNEHYTKLRSKCQLVNEQSPFVVDISSSEATLVDNPYSVNIWPTANGYSAGETPALRNILGNNLSAVYTNSFVDVINETRFAQPTANFSEKVFQAIQYQKPFIVVGPPKTLEYIRSLGFKTFNDFWDESYDDELHHGERLAKIFDVLEKIINTPTDELHNMYDSMRLTVEYNLTRYKEFIQ
jgi:hypothetical protein